MQLLMKVRISYRGKSVDAMALHDTGAEANAFIDNSIAAKLGLPKGDAIGYAGIAGSSVGFKSQVDNVTVLDNPQCSLSKVPVVIGTVTVPNVQLLVGEYFMRSTGMVTEVTEDGMKISCRKGPSIAVAQGIPKEYLIVGGVLLAAVAAFFLLKD